MPHVPALGHDIEWTGEKTAYQGCHCKIETDKTEQHSNIEIEMTETLAEIKEEHDILILIQFTSLSCI